MIYRSISEYGEFSLPSEEIPQSLCKHVAWDSARQTSVTVNGNNRLLVFHAIDPVAYVVVVGSSASLPREQHPITSLAIMALSGNCPHIKSVYTFLR